jgi:hypothetical protein
MSRHTLCTQGCAIRCDELPTTRVTAGRSAAERHAVRVSWDALPLAPDRCASWKGRCSDREPAFSVSRAREQSPTRASGAPVGVMSGRSGRQGPRRLRHPRWLPAPRQPFRRHRRRLSSTGARPEVWPRALSLRAGWARRSSGPVAGRTAAPAPVPGRGRAGPGRRRGRRPVDRRARRATSTSPGGSAPGGHGLRLAARPPAPPSGRRSLRGSVPRLDAGRWPSTTSGSGRGWPG